MSIEEFCIDHARVASKRHKGVKLDDKMTFFQQLQSLISAGVPLLKALQICAEQTQSDRLRDLLEDVAARVASGSELHTALSEHSRYFEDHWISLIGTGEASGTMEDVLVDLNIQIREAQETKRKVSGALMYPIILIFVAIAVLVVMLWFVVPTFGNMFKEMGAELPAITQYVINASDLIVQYGLYGVVGLGVGGFLFRKYMRTDAGMRNIYAVTLALPVIGELAVQSAMYRFSSNLALLLKNGVPLLDTMNSMATVFRSQPSYRDAILLAQGRVAAGRSLADALEESGLFTTMMINTIRIGEESAQLDNTMGQIAPYYKEKMNGFIAKVTKLLEPCIIIFMGCAISVVMLAIYIPMFEMSGKVN